MMLVQILTGAVAGILGSLVTTFATPRLHHYFWKLQRQAELRFATVTAINRLLSEYLTGYIAKPTSDPTWRPPKEFFVALRASSAELRVLFSDAAWQSFKNVEVLMTADGGLGHPGDRKTEYDFVQGHEQLLRILYLEIGL